MNNKLVDDGGNISLFNIILIILKSKKLFISIILLSLISIYSHEIFLEKKINNLIIKFQWNTLITTNVSEATYKYIDDNHTSISKIFINKITSKNLYKKVVSDYSKNDISLKNNKHFFVNNYENRSGYIEFNENFDVENKKQIIDNALSIANDAAKKNALDYVKNILSYEKNNLRLMKKRRESDLNIEKSNLIYEIEFLKLKLKYDKKNLKSLIEQSITIAEKMNFIEPALDQLESLYAVSNSELKSSTNFIDGKIEKSDQQPTPTLIDYRSSNPVAPLYFYGVKLLKLELDNINKNYNEINPNLFSSQTAKLNLIEKQRGLDFAGKNIHDQIILIERLNNSIDEIESYNIEYPFFVINSNDFVIEKTNSKFLIKLIFIMPIVLLFLIMFILFNNEMKQRNLSFKDL